jgi:hypothetical protein
MAGESSQGAAKASRPQLVASPAESQPTVAEERRAPVVVEAQQAAVVVEALHASYNSSEQELVELRSAALETCQAVEEGEAQAGSSFASRLRALGGHVSRRMRRALRLGVQKALGVVRSHYEINFEAVAEGYVVPEGIEDEAAMEHADALAADAAGALAEAFEEFLFPDTAGTDAPQA